MRLPVRKMEQRLGCSGLIPKRWLPEKVSNRRASVSRVFWLRAALIFEDVFFLACFFLTTFFTGLGFTAWLRRGAFFARFLEFGAELLRHFGI